MHRRGMPVAAGRLLTLGGVQRSYRPRRHRGPCAASGGSTGDIESARTETRLDPGDNLVQIDAESSEGLPFGGGQPAPSARLIDLGLHHLSLIGPADLTEQRP